VAFVSIDSDDCRERKGLNALISNSFSLQPSLDPVLEASMGAYVFTGEVPSENSKMKKHVSLLIAA
jgi:hypothetical protein